MIKGLIIIVAVVITLTLVNYMYRVKYTNDAAVFAERSIEILAPNLTQAESLRLRALYRSVDDAKSFKTLYDNLIKLSKEKDVRIPEFEPLIK